MIACQLGLLGLLEFISTRTFLFDFHVQVIPHLRFICLLSALILRVHLTGPASYDGSEIVLCIMYEFDV